MGWTKTTYLEMQRGLYKSWGWNDTEIKNGLEVDSKLADKYCRKGSATLSYRKEVSAKTGDIDAAVKMLVEAAKR